MAWFRQKKERFHVALRETASYPAKRPVRFAPYLQPTHPERKVGGAFPFQEFPRSKRIRQPTYPAREGASHFILQHFGDIPNVVEPKFLNIGLYCGY